MTTHARDIEKAFELISLCCENIRENDRCEDCPMRHMCVNDFKDSVVDFADLVSASAWQDFIDFSDECLPSESRQRDINDSRIYDAWKDREI